MDKIVLECPLNAGTHRPVMLEGEIELLVQDGVDLNSREGGVIRLTTHRLVWMDGQMNEALQVAHHHVAKVEGHSSFGWHRKYRVEVEVSAGELRLEFPGSQQRDKALTAYDKALREKLWQKAVKKEEFSSRNAGISGLIRNVEKRVKDDERNVASAFSDMEELGTKAKELVRLAERYKTQQKKGDNTKEEEDEMSSLLFGMGIASPITKESSGSLYHEELAREMAGFLPDIIRSQGGMMSMPDVYCVVNRARGTQLVSPDDVVESARMFKSLRLPLRFREFNSGVRVIQVAELEDSTNSKALLEMCKSVGHISAALLAKETGSSVALAMEKCLTAEEQGVLCRDSSLRGLLFFENRFLHSGN